MKLDVKRFFESISEIAAYRVFLGFGYQPLVALEFARLCSRVRSNTISKRWLSLSRAQEITAYQTARLGYLPQGAPTSPMLANLAVRTLDEQIEAIAAEHGLAYTRYADDIALSSKDDQFSRRAASAAIHKIYGVMGTHGLSPNLTKTRIIPPGGRKVVLGLLVDGSEPRLSREFRTRLQLHVHYIKKFGPINHQRKRGFDSVRSLRNHVEGLIRFARHIDPAFASQCANELASVSWPL